MPLPHVRSGSPAPTRRGARQRAKLLALRLLLVLGLTGLAFEGLVRGLLFEGWFGALGPVAELRDPFSFAGQNEDELYQLKLFLRKEAALPEAPNRDPWLGWRGISVLPDYDHSERGSLRGQRPVLLFGDSYAAGVGTELDSFQALFEETEYGASMELLNYGCGGYGLDQICMLAERALPLWAEQRPLVLMSLLIDDDMDRCRLELRPWPKPRYRVVEGRLELERETLPSTAEYMASAFPLTQSWGWRLLLHSLFPASLAERLSGEAASERRAREVSTLLLERTLADLRASGVSFGFVLFSNRDSIRDPATLEWRESLVLELLSRHGVPCVSTRQALSSRMAQDGRPEGDYFFLSGLARNHMTRLGNEIALQEMLALIETLVAGEPPYEPPPRQLELERFVSALLPGKRAVARYDTGREQLSLRVSPKGPTEVRYELEEPQLLCAEAWMPSGPNPPPQLRGSVDLTVLADEQVLFKARLERGAEPVPLKVALAGPSTVVIRASDAGDNARGDLVLLGLPEPR